MLVQANIEQMGVVATCNAGLAKVTTDYVYFASADDRVGEKFLSCAEARLASAPKAALCAQTSETFGKHLPTDVHVPSPMMRMRDSYHTPEEMRRLFQRYAQFINGNATVYRTAQLRALGGFPNLGPYSDGVSIVAMALLHGAFLCPEVNAAWRYSSDGYSVATRKNSSVAKRYIDEAHRYLLGTLSVAGIAGYARTWRGQALHHLISPRILEGDLNSVSDIAPVPSLLKTVMAMGGGGCRVANAFALLALAPSTFFSILRDKLGFSETFR